MLCCVVLCLQGSTVWCDGSERVMGGRRDMRVMASIDNGECKIHRDRENCRRTAYAQ